MKAKLLTVLSQCIYNKSIEDFNVIIDLINIVSDDKSGDIKITDSNIGLYISLYNDGMLFSVMFTDNNVLLFTLPDNIIKTYVIENCDYNIQYDGIKALLLSNK